MLIISIIYYILRNKELKQKISGKNILNLFVFVMIGILMSAVQLLPSLDLISISVRNNVVFKENILDSEKINFLNLLNSLYPYLFGSTHNNTFFGYPILKNWSMSFMGIYTGVISFLMFIISLKMYKNYKNLIFLWFLIFFTLIFSLGSNFPLNNLILNIPGFNYFRNLIKMLAFYSFFMVLLTVLIIYYITPDDIPQNLFKTIFIIAIFIITATLILKIFQNYILNINQVKIASLIKEKFLSASYHHYTYDYYYNKLKKTFSFVLDHILQQTTFIALYITALLAYSRQILNKEKLIVIIFLLTTIELFLNGKVYNKTINKEYITEQPKVNQFLKTKDKSLYRVLQWRFFENEKEVFKNGRANGNYDEFLLSKEIMQPNTNINSKIFSYWGYSPLLYKKYTEFYDDIDKGTLYGGKESEKFFYNGFNTLIISGVKYILSPYKIFHNNIEQISKIENIYIYKNKSFNEFVKFFTDIIYIKYDNEILKLIKEQKIDFKKTVIVKDTKNEKYNTGIGENRINIIKWGNGKIEFEINAQNEGIVFISNYFDSEKQNRDWLAYVDGKKVKILSANYIFMGLKIDKGFHKVELIYSPYFFKIGIFISLISFVVYILFSFILIRLKS